MNPSLRVLIVEDSEDDCLLLIRELRSGGYEPIFERVETAEAMKAALDEHEWEIVICDYSMPHFSAPDALRLMQETGLDLPFLVVSGTIGEDVAVEAMKAGANDYLMKGNLKRLCPAIERELREAQGRRERKRAEKEILRRNRELSVLYAIDRAASQSLDLEEILNDALEATLKALEVEAGGIFLLEPDGETMMFRVHRGVSDEFVQNVQPIKLGEGISGRAAAEKRTVLLDVSDYPTERLAPFIVAEGLQTLASTPLLAAGQLVGALNLGTRRVRAFSPEELELLTAVGQQLAMAIQNARLYEKLQRELTERRQAQEALCQSEARYRAIVEQSPDGIFLVEPDTRSLIESNTAFQRILGYPAEEIRGLTLYDFVDAAREKIDLTYQELLRGENPISIERRLRRKDGSLAEVWASATLISYGERRVTCHLVRDLTEKKALEAQFLRAQRMESIGLLAGGIAHDLNNILAPVLMNAELLQGSLPDSPHQKLLSSIVSSAQRGADIVKQILTFSRGIEEGRLAISLKNLLKEMQRFAKETFPKSIAIEVEIPQDLWPLSGDATQLHQVLMNLCLNARDAMPHGGTLSLSVRNFSSDEAYAKMHPEAKVGPYLVFSVEDTGCGILPSDLEKIFDPFFTTKERGKGTGLGLSTTQAIVKGHGGFIRIYSEVGKGTKFLVFLPASPTAEMAKAEKERAPLPSGHGELILVVEDEVSIREITQVTLEAWGYRVLSAADGSEAVALYVQHKGEIQVLLTDMAMPVMDGLATIRALHRINPHLKVIAISGAEWEEKAAEATSLSVQAFLHKPFTAERLLRTVAEVLGGKKA